MSTHLDMMVSSRAAVVSLYRCVLTLTILSAVCALTTSLDELFAFPLFPIFIPSLLYSLISFSINILLAVKFLSAVRYIPDVIISVKYFVSLLTSF